MQPRGRNQIHNLSRSQEKRERKADRARGRQLDRLIADAALAEELFGADELEEFAEEWRGCR